MGAMTGLAVPAAVLYAGWRMLHASDPYAPMAVESEDSLMREAIEKARASLHVLTDGVAEARDQAFVKFPLVAPSGATEHIWGIVHAVRGDEAVVSLANDPIHEQPAGQTPRMTTRLRDAEDWMLVDQGGRIRGGYTTIAMFRIYERDHGSLPKSMRRDLEVFVDS
jgi:uncharacterized protein YegJ (DUF2314 family)